MKGRTGFGLGVCGCWVQALGLLVEGEEGKERKKGEPAEKVEVSQLRRSVVGSGS